jgi:8-oxo-dGTP pyrophosphatase MutT (NUDIX family)
MVMYTSKKTCLLAVVELGMENVRDQDRFYATRDEKTGRLLILREVACLVLLADINNVASVLMVSSRKKPSQWTLPKGGWELRESLPHAALREAFEEAGVGTHAFPDPTLRSVAEGASSGHVVVVNHKDKVPSFLSQPGLPASLREALHLFGPTAVGEVSRNDCSFGTRFNWVFVDSRRANPESWTLLESFPEVEDRSRRWTPVATLVDGGGDAKPPFADIVAAAVGAHQ